ncbi:tetratricopeptide repeat-containing sensor histidine kinase [Mucilaginibacter sp. UYCu711]|uniref:tetratricopeptide repeat-containing sensor histidine kinase n=1 Tax=Mucilaginibacter sp. UYCu711 TaxID=3156339 RepID=UPI003D25DC45
MHHLRHRAILSVILLLLSANTLKAQMDYFNKQFLHKKDSLVKELAKHPLADTSRVRALVNLMNSAVFLDQKKQVIPYFEEANRLSFQLKSKNGKLACLYWKGRYYKSAKKADSSLVYLDSVIAVAGNSGNPRWQGEKASAFFDKGVIYDFREDFYTALNNYFEALKCYDGVDLPNQAQVARRIASVYKVLHNSEKTLEYSRLAIKLFEKIHDKFSTAMIAGIYTEIADVYYDRGELTKASTALNKIKPRMPDTTDEAVTSVYYYLAGQIALKEKKADYALVLLNQAIKYYNYAGHMDDLARIYAAISRLQMEKNNMAEAKKYVEQSMALAKQTGHKETMVTASVAMAAYLNESGNQLGAYQSLHQAIVLNDSLLNETNIKQASTLAAIYENSQKEKTIAQLEREKQVQAAAVKQKTLLNIILTVTIIALLIISFAAYLNYKNRQKIERQKITNLEKEKQLMEAEALIKGQEEERVRLAKDLHDGVGSMLSGVKISFSNMKENLVMDQQNAVAFEKSIWDLDQTIAELRKVAHNLMPETLVKFGLKNAVKDFCESMQLMSNTPIICEQFGPERPLGNIAEVNIYRIIQELVNNAIKHGNASQVVVQLTRTPVKVLITVEDNGNGFVPDAQEKPPGIGLSNIQSRVNYLNGHMHLESKPAEGTTINIELMV